MKKVLFLLFSVLLLLEMCACGHITVKQNSPVRLCFHYGNTTIDTQTSEWEAAKLRNVVMGKILYPDSPSCGFCEEVSFRIDGAVYSPACDGCCIVMDCSSGKYFSISRAERETIERIFETYGGFFPCV